MDSSPRKGVQNDPTTVTLSVREESITSAFWGERPKTKYGNYGFFGRVPLPQNDGEEKGVQNDPTTVTLSVREESIIAESKSGNYGFFTP